MTTQTAILTHDPIGTLALENGLVQYLTACCTAAIIASRRTSSGVACSICRQEVGAELDVTWLPDNQASWELYRARLSAHIGDSATEFAIRVSRTATQHIQPPAARAA
ncbi:hypothetical protein B5P44_00380 [Mycobacterium sp. CBMA 213]|uniref:Uncharacterized protein n=1 Tax=Mycolicibacterium sp. CBMA 213 TaxID=1968788 RepID=A0A343VR56_9MYCO|nr:MULTISPECIES: hypothetical protein [unclassified Mycolicibacterium]AVN58380.1 hypothetical protein B5P44_p00085 [Mycolicibacterium sp. CBMA 213]MUL61042.1 hypothetical protein [Mycolicibacterium sp. CBMA 335]MUM03279.1 hypothetical protein [Mycolicibacterium sp. CBMA 213]